MIACYVEISALLKVSEAISNAGSGRIFAREKEKKG